MLADGVGEFKRPGSVPRVVCREILAAVWDGSSFGVKRLERRGMSIRMTEENHCAENSFPLQQQATAISAPCLLADLAQKCFFRGKLSSDPGKLSTLRSEATLEPFNGAAGGQHQSRSRAVLVANQHHLLWIWGAELGL